MRKIQIRVALGAAVVSILVAISAFRARSICDQTIGAEISPPPHYST